MPELRHGKCGVTIYVEETQKSNYDSGDSILHL